MSPRDPRLPPESAPRAVETHADSLAVTSAAGARPTGEAAQPGERGATQTAQVWALYPLASREPQAEPAAPKVDLLRLLPEVARRGRRSLVLGLLAGFAFGAAYLFL